jgi:hypothetical protein
MAGGEAVEHEAVGIIAKAAKDVLPQARRLVTTVLGDGVRTPKEIVKTAQNALISTLKDSDRAAITTFRRGAQDAERTLTPTMERIAASSGGELAGKEFAVKGEESLARKVATDLGKDGSKTVEGSLAGIKDSVRYTIKAGHDDYTSVTNDAMERMRAAGFERQDVKNFWGKDGYQGINSVWKDPATGRTFEMQFHTADSLEAKEATHEIYDVARLPATPPDLGGQLEGLQNQVFDKVEVPAGAPAIGPRSG